MPAHSLHPFDARFLKLAVVQQLLTPAQVRQVEDAFQRRLDLGQVVTIEQILQEEGYLTDTECQSLWELIAQAADTHARVQISERREAIDVATSEALAIPKDLGHVPDLGKAYNVTGLIGRGGMGTVYRARQLNMDREVALKVLRADLTANARYIRRFIREARAAGQLDHPNLVRVYDVGEAGSGGWFMTMEFVEGRTVRHLLRREGRLNLLESLRILAQVSAALECAHRSKIIHRDIKPDNIMITSRGVAKLCDLGLAKALEGPLQDTDTQEGSTLGTPHYMSPEQAQGRPLDERSDLFSLGATFYHMVTGQVPFTGQSALEIMLRVSSQDPTPPEHLEPLLPPPVCNLIRRLMARDPLDRPPSAEVVRKEFEALCRDLTSGRIFAYEDRLPHPSYGRPVLTRADHRWIAGLASAAVFLLLCIVMRGAGGSAPIPPVEPLIVTRPAAQPAAESGTTQESPAAKTKAQRVAAGRQPARPDQELIDLEGRLETSATDWPQLLAVLRNWEQQHNPVPAPDQERLAYVRDKLIAARSMAAEEDWEQRWPAVQAFARTGHLATARKLLDRLPVRLRPALTERLRQAHGKLQETEQAWATNIRSRYDTLQRAGHRKLAGALLAAAHDVLSVDDAPELDTRRIVLQELSTSLAERTRLDEKQRQTKTTNRTLFENTLKKIRTASAKHDIEMALAICSNALAKADRGCEADTLKAEFERLKRVQRLFKTISDALAKHPRLINEKDFRPNEANTGSVIGMTKRHLVVLVPNAGRRDSEAQIPLERIPRKEIGNLIEQVFVKHSLAPDDRVGRLAYSFGNIGSNTRLRLHAALSAGGPDDQAWLQVLMQAEGFQRQAQAEDLLEQAEQMHVDERFTEALRLLAAARETLGSTPEPRLLAKFKSLLAITSWAESRSRLMGGTWNEERRRLDASAVDLAGVWSWSPAEPSVAERCIDFLGQESSAQAPWRLVGRCRVVCDIAIPPAGSGRFTLGFGDGKRIRALVLKSENGDTRIGLMTLGRLAPAWSSIPLGTIDGRIRVWLSADNARLSWGVDARTLGAQFIEPNAEWSLHLSARHGLKLYGLRAEGVFMDPASKPGNPGAALLAAALEKPVGSRNRSMQALLTSPLLNLPQRATAYAAYADENRTLGMENHAHAWDALALYACPPELLPAKVRALEAKHKKRQEQMERDGVIFRPSLTKLD